MRTSRGSTVTRALVIALPLLLLGACNFEANIKTDALAYNGVVEDTVDKLLVINILRSRDHAPLHFGAIPNIHEGFQTSAGFTTTTPFGPLLPKASTAVDSLGLNGSVQSTPSFDMNTLDTKDFITGISNPIDPKYAKYWLDRGLDPRIVLLLFFSSATISEKVGNTEEAITLDNDPRVQVENPRVICPGLRPTEADHTIFDLYLLLINKLAQEGFFANAYSSRRAIITDITLSASGKTPTLRDLGSMLKDVTSLDPSKFALAPQPAKKGEVQKYTLYQTSSEPSIAFCFNHGNNLQRTNADSDTDEESGFCNRSTVDRSLAAQARQRPPTEEIPATDAARFCPIFHDFMGDNPTPSGRPPRLNLTMRSVGDMIAFLGDLTYYEEALQNDEHHHIPLKLGYCRKDQANCRDGGTLFWIDNPHPVDPRFAVDYRGQSYTVDRYSPDDHTLQVLAILNQLLNVNKSAQDIRTTPFVEILP